VQASTAGIFFKSISEDSTPINLMSSLSKGADNEKPSIVKPLGALKSDLQSLKKEVENRLGASAAAVFEGLKKEGAKNAFVLLYAHLARLPLSSPVLQQGLFSSSSTFYFCAHVWQPKRNYYSRLLSYCHLSSQWH
jgi:translocation protein SEC63